MKHLTRRDILRLGVATAGTLGAPWLLTNCSNQHSIPEPPREIKAQVAAIRGDLLDSMARDAIDALGGMRTVVNEGDTVFIKPNFVSFPWAQHNQCFHVGECTKPEILIAVTEECLKAGAKEVIIGDGSHLPAFDWRYAITLDGSTNLVNEAAHLSSLYAGTVILACLEKDSPAWIEVPSQTSLNTIAI
jgi:hypothetical protein